MPREEVALQEAPAVEPAERQAVERVQEHQRLRDRQEGGAGRSASTANSPAPSTMPGTGPSRDTVASFHAAAPRARPLTAAPKNGMKNIWTFWNPNTRMPT